MPHETPLHQLDQILAEMRDKGIEPRSYISGQMDALKVLVEELQHDAHVHGRARVEISALVAWAKLTSDHNRQLLAEAERTAT